jgi:hypothetical protein
MLGVGANESSWHCEADLSQKACTILSEISSRPSCWNVEGAYSNLSCTVVMGEGRQKSNRLSYTAKFKREVIRCAEGKGNRKAATIFGVDESNVRLWRKHKESISGWGAMKEIHRTQERTISWNWWCNLHVFSRETQDWAVCDLWSTLRAGDKEGQILTFL